MNDLQKLLGVGAAAALAVSVGACAGAGSSSGAQSGVASGGSNTTITVWTWDGTVEDAVPGFEEANPGIKVEVVNAGSSSDQYKALDNAIQAGTGIPDAVQFEYFAIPYFAIPGKLYNMSEAGVDYADEFVPSAWSNVTVDGSVFALPSDYGPAAMFYNQATFELAGIDAPPTTWDEFYEDARLIRALGDDYYIANDSTDLFLLLSLIWESGGRPFDVDGFSVDIDFAQEDTARAVDFWQKMIDEDLVTTKIANWSDEWNRSLNDGTLATQVIGGWLTASLPERAPDASGDFRVALMPQWESGQTSGAENGGSSMGIPVDASHPEEALKFLEYMTVGEGLDTRVDAGAFVANTRILTSSEFQETTTDYFGDQKYNEVLAEAAANVEPGWQYPPFFEWARSVYPDIASGFYTSRQGSLTEVLSTWTDRMIEYGNEQGFEVN